MVYDKIVEAFWVEDCGMSSNGSKIFSGCLTIVSLSIEVDIGVTNSYTRVK